MKRKRDRSGEQFEKYYENPGPADAAFRYVKNTAENREKRIRIDPIAYCLTVRVANLLTKNAPMFLDKEGNEIEKITEQWLKKGYNEIFREVIKVTRTHGYSVTELLKTKFAGRDYMVYRAIDIITSNYGKDMNIKSYTVRPHIEEGERINKWATPDDNEVEADKCLHYQIGTKTNIQQGIGTLTPVWDNLLRANFTLESMTAYDIRFGQGWPVVYLPTKYFKKLDEINKSITDMNSKRYLVLPKDAEDQTELKMFTANSNIDYPKHLETILGYIASASGFPIRFFIGDPKGALSAAEEDARATARTLTSVFAEFENWIRNFIEKYFKNGEAISNKIAEIRFNDEGLLEQLTDEMTRTEEQTKFVANEEQKKVADGEQK